MKEPDIKTKEKEIGAASVVIRMVVKMNARKSRPKLQLR
jgi:hypothetical protein